MMQLSETELSTAISHLPHASEPIFESRIHRQPGARGNSPPPLTPCADKTASASSTIPSASASTKGKERKDLSCGETQKNGGKLGGSDRASQRRAGASGRTGNWEATTPARPELPTAADAPDRETAEQLNGKQESEQFSKANAQENSLSSAPPPAPPQPPESQEGFLPVLKNRNFLSLWSGQVFSQLADKVYLVLTIALIASRFHPGENTLSSWVSAITIAFTIPAVLLGSLAGAFVDRWSKKAVLVTTNLLRGLLVLALPFLLWLSEGKELLSLPLGFCALLVVTLLVSSLTQFFAPAEQAAIPLIVERRHLLSANSLYTTTMMGSLIIGFAVGEPLLAIADRLFGFADMGKELVVGGCYCAAGLLLLLLKTKEKLLPSERESPHVLEDIRDGLRYLKEQRHVRAALIQLMILFSIFAALAVLAVPLAKLTGLKPTQFGFLLAAGGLGMAASAGFIGYVGQRFSHAQLSLAGSLGMAGSLIGLSLFTRQLWPELVLITLLGATAAVVGVPMQTTIQAETPEEMRGKVFGLQNNAINIALSLPLALAGVAETFFGLKVVFLGLAVLAIAGALLTWYISGTGIGSSSQTDAHRVDKIGG